MDPLNLIVMSLLALAVSYSMTQILIYISSVMKFLLRSCSISCLALNTRRTVYAVLIALEFWQGMLFNALTLVYVDNEESQSALVADRSSAEEGRGIIQGVTSCERSSVCRPWFGRAGELWLKAGAVRAGHLMDRACVWTTL